MAEGSPGAAIGMDVERMFDIRKQALKLLQLAATEKSSLLFGLTTQITKKDAVPFENLLDALYSVLADLLELTSGTASAKDIRILLRNPGLKKELQELAVTVDTAWVTRAVRGVELGKLSGVRRNINRQLCAGFAGTFAFGALVSKHLQTSILLKPISTTTHLTCQSIILVQESFILGRHNGQSQAYSSLPDRS